MIIKIFAVALSFATTTVSTGMLKKTPITAIDAHYNKENSNFDYFMKVKELPDTRVEVSPPLTFTTEVNAQIVTISDGSNTE